MLSQRRSRSFAPQEVSDIAEGGQSEVQLALALTCFAGIRGAELARLDWKDIKFEAGFMRVRAASAKTGIRRVRPSRQTFVPGCCFTERNPARWSRTRTFYNQYAKVAQKAKVKWKRNAHRHGFASYRTALIKNLEQVAIEAGNSKQMLLSNYFQLVSETGGAGVVFHRSTGNAPGCAAAGPES